MNNKNKILLMALGALLMNGCVVKEKFVANASFKKQSFKPKTFEKKKSLWKKKEPKIIEACVDCFATPLDNGDMRMAKLDKSEVITYDYSNAPIDTFNNVIDYSTTTKVSMIKSVEKNMKTASYAYDTYDINPTNEMKYHAQPVSYVNSSYGTYSTKTAIQIGAFRRYEGAKVYARKYDLLSSKYHVKIQTGMKENMPLHRVRIEGFNTRGEAQNFIARYGISDAFLVRR